MDGYSGTGDWWDVENTAMFRRWEEHSDNSGLVAITDEIRRAAFLRKSNGPVFSVNKSSQIAKNQKAA